MIRYDNKWASKQIKWINESCIDEIEMYYDYESDDDLCVIRRADKCCVYIKKGRGRYIKSQGWLGTPEEFLEQTAPELANITDAVREGMRLMALTALEI